MVLKHLPAIRALLEITTTITLLDTFRIVFEQVIFLIEKPCSPIFIMIVPTGNAKLPLFLIWVIIQNRGVDWRFS